MSTSIDATALAACVDFLVSESIRLGNVPGPDTSYDGESFGYRNAALAVVERFPHVVPHLQAATLATLRPWTNAIPS